MVVLILAAVGGRGRRVGRGEATRRRLPWAPGWAPGARSLTAGASFRPLGEKARERAPAVKQAAGRGLAGTPSPRTCPPEGVTMPGDPPASPGGPAESSHRRGGAARTRQLPGLVLLTSSLAGNRFSHCGAPRLSRPQPGPGPRGASRPLPAPAGLSAGRGCSERQCRPEASRPEAPRPQPPSARHRAWSLPAGPRRASVPHGDTGTGPVARRRSPGEVGVFSIENPETQAKSPREARDLARSRNLAPRPGREDGASSRTPS